MIKTFGNSFVGRDNALGLIRLILAAMVIVSHAFPTGGLGDDPFGPWAHNQTNLGGVAVAGFFVLSGYLITKSGKNADVVQFVWHRFLRIFPAFWVVLLVGAFIVGPIVWLSNGGTLGTYFTTGPLNPFGYFYNNWNLTVTQYGIHDIYVNDTPYGAITGFSIFNGSLWTLAYEWSCYLIIAAFVLFGVLKKARALVLIVTGVFFALQVAKNLSPDSFGGLIPLLSDPRLVNLALAFLVGACFALYANEIVFDWRLGIGGLIVVLVSLHYGGFEIVGYPAMAYFLLWLAAALPSPFRRIGRVNDYSYGIYLYGFLLQQFLASFGVEKLGIVPFILIVFVLSLGCAWLSWHLIEKQVMKLKNRGPGQGIAFWVSRARQWRQSRRGGTTEPRPAPVPAENH
ncbi:acyltransferase family protein [Herbiconiux solani]|uniref:acyltransferase family protein n=1 Tax=Herbiconiux solani TaxID=661329 RepID=UPI000825DEDE|nr:acyltransferase [Herbiconiux solani]